MKIITQSTKVASQPYFHLAYLAASHKSHNASLFSFGMLFIITGCVILIKPLKSKTKKGFTLITLSFRKKPKIIIAGLCLLLLGAGMLPLSYRSGRTVYDHPEAITEMDAEHLYKMIQGHLKEGQPIPESIEDMRKQWELGAKVKDGWSKAYKLQKIESDGGPIYHILSAGKDSIFGTQDDIGFPPPETSNN
jgi:hypothetical protein